MENNLEAPVKSLSGDLKEKSLTESKLIISSEKNIDDKDRSREMSLTKEEIDILSSNSSELVPQQKFMEEITKTINFDIVRELIVRPHKYNTSPTRMIKMTSDLQRPFVIIDNGVDCTPKRAINPGDPRWVTDPMLFNFPTNTYREIKPDDFIITGRKKTSNWKASVLEWKQDIDLKIESSASGSESDEEASKAPSMFNLKYPEPIVVNKMQTSFVLQETNTTVLLDLPSMIGDTNSDEGHLVTRVNTMYSTICKRLRKKMDNYCQTSTKDRQKIKETQLSRSGRCNKYAFCSRWDQFDSFLEAERLKNKDIPSLNERSVGKVSKIKYAEEKALCEPIVGDKFKIVDSTKWFKMTMIMERVLLSNNAMERQLIFHDDLKSNPICTDVEFKYNLNRLCTLRTDKTEGMPVTCMSWNSFDPNILAVGYGKFHFTDKNVGFVSVWNNKNLAHPERQYSFTHAVTSLSFCKSFPDILAIAFYSGWVILINILRKENVKVIAKNMPFNETCVSPVWALAWKQAGKLENVVECKGDGFVYEYTRKHLYEKRQIMKIAKMKGIVKGIAHQKKCQPYVIPLVRSPAILCIAFDPVDYSNYYLGTDEGGVYKCSIQDVHQHVEMFLAHNGPVYTIQFHPACNKVFLTCGADWYIRIWGDGIHSPLITMMSGISAIQSACWCPTLPTIILSVTDTKIELWDISRRVVYPQAVYENPKGAVNTALIFSNFGNNLCVGDKKGNVHIYALSNMPFQPSNADMVLALILIKALTPRRKILNELVKLGPPFNVSRIYKNYLNI